MIQAAGALMSLHAQEGRQGLPFNSRGDSVQISFTVVVQPGEHLLSAYLIPGGSEDGRS